MKALQANSIKYSKYKKIVANFTNQAAFFWLCRFKIYDIGTILRESLDHERDSLNSYKALLALVEGESIMLEEYARTMIYTEELHLGEVDKMLRNPGDVEPFSK